MSRLVDIDALRKDFKVAERCDDCPQRKENCVLDRVFAHRDVCGILDDAPTIDAEPIRHGRWVKMTESPEWDQKRCSVCGDISCCQRNYRPNCGAKMDEEENNETD